MDVTAAMTHYSFRGLFETHSKSLINDLIVRKYERTKMLKTKWVIVFETLTWHYETDVGKANSSFCQP